MLCLPYAEGGSFAGEDEVTSLAVQVLVTCLLLCSATASMCPATLGPLLAGRLLPLYGAASVIDCLLDDIYHKGKLRVYVKHCFVLRSSCMYL